MGMSPTARLVYGYDLGSSDSWKVHQVGEYGELNLDWLGEDEDFVGAAQKRLLASVGFTETDWRVDGYHDRQRAAEKLVGAKIVRTGSFEYSGHCLAFNVGRAEWSETDTIDFPALREQAVAEDWDGKLARAMAALGLTTDQAGPQWILTAFYG